MLLKSCALLSLLTPALAWPQVMQMMKREEPPPRQPLFKSGRQNTGAVPGLAFNEREQRVNVGAGSGHEYRDPGSGDRRGQCPGLNAAYVRRPKTKTTLLIC